VEQSLRAGLANLESAGQLLRIAASVDWKYEAAAILWQLVHGPAVLMTSIAGYPDAMLAGNLVTSKQKFAQAVGWPLAEVQPRLADAVDHRQAPEVVGFGPVQEVVQTADIDILRDFPVPLVSEFDGGRYISAGLVVTRDPVSGRRNMCVQRIQVHGPDRLGIFMAATDNRRFLERHRERGERMQVAIVVGNHPAILAASQYQIDGDEFEIAGALLGEPVRLIRAQTVDLEVPSEAEIALEGYIDPDETELEGPFGELLDLYSPRLPQPVIHLTRVTHRQSPIFQMICASSHPEHLTTGSLGLEGTLYRAVREVVPTVRAVVVPEGGYGRYHVVVSITKRSEDDPRKAIEAVLACLDRVRQVIVVDDDVDAEDNVRVQQALVTRMRANQHLSVNVRSTTHHMDPTMIDGTIATVTIDATQRLDSPTRGLPAARPPARTMTVVRERWRELGLPEWL
jgi:2,5-furandicarboxylate decarboxylase 1